MSHPEGTSAEKPGVPVIPGEYNPELYPGGLTVAEAYVEFKDDAYGAALGWTRNHHDAEDAVQGAIEQVLKTVETSERVFVHESQVKHYIKRAAVNKTHDQNRRQVRPNAPHLSAEFNGIAERTASPEPTTEEEVMNSLFSPEVEQALGQINPDFRDVVLAVDVHGLTYDECSEKYGVKRSTVATRVYRGRQQLKQILSPQPPQVV
jgi:RNA polymerase sigma-70 factor (ECF subfamily)